MSFNPGDRVEYLPSGNWKDGCALKAIFIETVKSGHRKGCLRIKLTEPDWRIRGAHTRIVQVDKVRPQ